MSNIPEHIEALGEGYARLWRGFTEFPTRLEVAERIRVFKPRSLANLDCQGKGPGGRVTIGGRVCYPRDQVVIWFASLAGQQSGPANDHSSRGTESTSAPDGGRKKKGI